MLYSTYRVQSLKDESVLAEAVREQKADESQRQQQARREHELDGKSV